MPKVLTYQERTKRAKARKDKSNAKMIEETKVYTVRVYKESQLAYATEKAASDAGKLPGQYLRGALVEKLKREGYLTENSDDSIEE